MKPEPKASELKTLFEKHQLTIAQSYDHFKTDLYTVLIEKTTGDARERVKTIEMEADISDRPDGVLAHSRVHRWFC